LASALACLGVSGICFSQTSQPSQSNESQREQDERLRQRIQQQAAEAAAQPQRQAADPQLAARQRIQALLQNIDPAVLNRLLGADVKVEVVAGKVIITGPEEAVNTFKQILQLIDTEVEPKAVRVVQVTERDAKEVSKQLQDALRTALKFANQKPEEEITLTAVSSNIILVSALPKDIDFVVELIQQVDEVPDPLGKIELMSFDVKHRRASDVAAELEKVLTQLQKAAGVKVEQSKLQIIPNNANNTISVTARESERPKIQALIDNIDVEPKKGWGETKLTIYPLLHSKAKDLAEVIKNLLTFQAQAQTGGTAGGRPGGSAQAGAVQEVLYRLVISKALPTGERIDLPPIDLQKPLKIQPDEGTNSLIVATVEDNVGPIGELVRLLDGVPLGEDMDIRLYPLRFGDAEKVKELLDSMFEQGKKLPEDPDGSAKEAVPSDDIGKALVYNVNVTVEARTNTLIVSGRAEQLSLVDRVVSELDRPAASLKFPLRMYPLRHGDATRMAEIIRNLFEKRIESAEATGASAIALERERVFMTVDVRSNTLIVSASPENIEEVTTITAQLDVKPSRAHDHLRIIPCHRLTAMDLKEKIDELWERRTALRGAEELIEDKPVVAVDERSNVLIVASSREDFEEIQSIVEVLESQPAGHDTQLYKLVFADATVLAGTLDKLFEGLKGQSESFVPPTILPDVRCNTLLVAAAKDTMDRVNELVRRLDVESGPKTAEFRVYPLSFGSALKLAPRMQELFDSRAADQDTPKTPIVLLADESSNSVVCSASRDDHEVIVELLTLLDRPSNIAKQFQIFPLKLAKSASVAERLESLFQSQGEGGSGRADAMAVEADERTNALIVWASPTEMENIAEVISKLDTVKPAVEMMVKVIQLKQALATDFAELLTKTLIGEASGGDEEKAIIVSFLEKRPDGSEAIRKLLRQDIRVEPDPRTNSLMVMAPLDSMGMLEAMILDFDRIRPVTSEIRLFPLINSDAETMMEQLTELFKPQEGGGEDQPQGQLVLGGQALGELDLATVGQELRFASDPRTNTLIVAGAEIYLRMVDELVRFLDSQEAEDRVNEVYKARYLDATELATAIQNFVQQEQDVLGESDDQTSQMRRQERQVSIESLGNVDEGSSQLIIGTSRRAYQRTMEILNQLDQPEPQVMISVLIAEVSLSDGVELGVEIAGQDLTFTENAVMGPNGTLDGSDFDWVAGTDLGAAGLGLGGFNFTITGEDFSFLLHALQTDSRIEVLSRPILLVRNGEEGKITIADQVPYVESTQINDTGSTNSSIAREDVGIILTTTPHISPDGFVTVELKQELSNISGRDVQLTEGVASPVFQTREVDTNVTVRDGETVVIGGLITSREEEAEAKFPILGDIPLLGFLFRNTRVNKTKTELLVVLTVDILRTDDDIRKMSVEQRDKFVLPDSIRQSPLMEGLRIRPDESGFGPIEANGKAAPPSGKTRAREQYGPKPKTYGPVVKPKASSSTASSGPVYGPKVVANRTHDEP
jgi:type II secretion system protein D